MPQLVFPVKRRDHFMYPAAMFRTEARPDHGGLDLTPVVAGRSEPYYAIESGIVTIADHTLEKGDLSGLDVMILGDETRIRWWGGHLFDAIVFRGQRVRAGQLIGYTGSTGNSSGAHLHQEAHYPLLNAEIDPWPWLADAPDVDGSTMPLAESRTEALAIYPKYVPPVKGDEKGSGGLVPPVEEDDMYTTEDRDRDDKSAALTRFTNAAVGRIENHVVQLRLELNKVAIDAGLARWASVEGRTMLAEVRNALAELPDTTLAKVELDEQGVDRVIGEVVARLQKPEPAQEPTPTVS